jgi:catechol 2,3-dioxygenase-like lactoylglutathione lyase family enzyme
MRQHIGEFAILVRDYDEAISWFTQKLGFSLRANDPLPNGERWVTVGPDTGEASLRLARAENEVQAAQVGRQAEGRVLCYLHTDNFARDYEAFIRRGVHFTELPRNEPCGTVAVFEDICGNWWDLIEHRAR